AWSRSALQAGETGPPPWALLQGASGVSLSSTSPAALAAAVACLHAAESRAPGLPRQASICFLAKSRSVLFCFGWHSAPFGSLVPGSSALFLLSELGAALGFAFAAGGGGTADTTGAGARPVAGPGLSPERAGGGDAATGGDGLVATSCCGAAP